MFLFVLLRAPAYCRRCCHQPHPVLLSNTVKGISQSPLGLAILEGDMELVKMLIAKGADLNTPKK